MNFGSIMFDASAARTIAGNTAGLSGVISGFAQADTIDLIGLTEAVQDYTVGTLTLVGDKTVTLQLPDAFTTASFQTAPDAGTGTDVFLVCFAAGTRIMTDRGEIAVEALKVGETVLTLRGDARPIVWIGTGQVLATPGRRTGNTPVIVRKGALADAVPSRDMRLPKGHSLFLDGALIPVEHLVNHRSILWDERAREVTIYHIELETHDVLIADGAPAESYRDDGNRWQLRNANSSWDCRRSRPARQCSPVAQLWMRSGGGW